LNWKAAAEKRHTQDTGSFIVFAVILQDFILSIVVLTGREEKGEARRCNSRNLNQQSQANAPAGQISELPRISYRKRTRTTKSKHRGQRKRRIANQTAEGGAK